MYAVFTLVYILVGAGLWVRDPARCQLALWLFVGFEKGGGGSGSIETSRPPGGEPDRSAQRDGSDGPPKSAVQRRRSHRSAGSFLDGCIPA